MIPKFPLGRVVATPGALQAISEAAETPAGFLRRHLTGDWGDLDESDRRENDVSLAQGFRLLSAYKLRTGVRVRIITEADRSATTILLPEEY